MFNWEEFENGKTAVHCDTEEKAKDFLKECEAHNLKWVDGDKASKFNPWGGYRERTTITHRHNHLCYSTKEFFTDVQIIDWRLSNMKEFTKSDLKDGMIIELRNRDRYIKLGENIIDKGGFLRLEGAYDASLFDKDDEDYDIMKVYKCEFPRFIDDIFTNEKLKLIWERKELVDFMVAVKAFNEGKTITCKIDGRKYNYIPGRSTACGLGHLLEDNYKSTVSTTEILAGKWYIEE